MKQEQYFWGVNRIYTTDRRAKDREFSIIWVNPMFNLAKGYKVSIYVLIGVIQASKWSLGSVSKRGVRCECPLQGQVSRSGIVRRPSAKASSGLQLSCRWKARIIRFGWGVFFCSTWIPSIICVSAERKKENEQCQCCPSSGVLVLNLLS